MDFEAGYGAPPEAVTASAREAAQRLRGSGSFDGIEAAFGYADLQRLFPNC